jgi:hypothetical protein
MTRRRSTLVALPLALALAAPAAAQTTTDPTPPPPKDARMSIAIKSGQVDGGKQFEITGDRLLVKGHMWPYVEGQRVTIELYRSGQLVDTSDVKVEKDETRQNAGKYQHRFDLNDEGKYTVVAKHAATPDQEQGESDTEKVTVVPAHVRKDDAQSIRLLQISLNRLAYVSPINGKLDDATRRGVLAFRKVQGWKHTGSPTSDLFRRVFQGRGAFKLRHTSPSRHVEGDLTHQVLVLTDNGKPDQIYTTSSGKPSTPTVKGTFKFYRSQPGANSHGMYYSRYFYRGYAVHGYPSVPATYPASHGCFRVPMADAYHIYQSIFIGETIYVYD